MGVFSRLFSRKTETRGKSFADPALSEWFMGGGALTASGAWVTPTTARRSPTVSACAALLADTIATIPLNLYRRGPDDSRERQTDNPLHALMHDAPNDWQTSTDFRRFLMDQICFEGYACARLYGAGRGMRLEPVESKRVKPRRINGQVWFEHQPKTGAREMLTPDELLFIRGRYPKADGLECESPVERNRELIGQAMAVGEYVGRFFGNGATPRGALKFAERIKDKAAGKLIRDQWEDRHQGAANSNRIAILDGFEWQDIGASNVDSQAAELLSRFESMIAGRIYQIPLHMIGEVEKSTSWGTGIEQQSIGLITYTIRPYAVTIEAALNRTLLTASQRAQGFYFEFNMDGLLRGDFKTQMEGYALMIQWGLASPNEIRRKMNLPPLPGGDSRLQPLNMAPAERIMDVLLKPSGATSSPSQRDLTLSLSKGEGQAAARQPNGETHA